MPGVIYIQSVPPFFTVKRLREIMARFGDLGRVYLQGEKRGRQRRKRYTEGWVEFKCKRVAKDVAQRLNGQLVGGKRRSAAYDSIWTMKYLHGFKWEHLMEQLAYERRIEQQRLRTEIVLEKRKAEHFSQQVEKGERLKQLEEKILKKCGLWERYQLQHRQREVLEEERKVQSRQLNNDEGFLRMIFGEKSGKNDNDDEVVPESDDEEQEEAEKEIDSDEEEEAADEKPLKKANKKMGKAANLKRRRRRQREALEVEETPNCHKQSDI